MSRFILNELFTSSLSMCLANKNLIAMQVRGSVKIILEFYFFLASVFRVSGNLFKLNFFIRVFKK